MEKPIGYWLKHLDRLIEQAFDDRLGERGVSRRQWQILNTLSRSEQTRDELAEALRPFWVDPLADLDEVTETLSRRGWVATDGPRYRLTPPGLAAHVELTARIGAIRELVSQGISAQEYRTTTDTLRRMAANLERH